jgi:D-amino-acid dehydrogenase
MAAWLGGQVKEQVSVLVRSCVGRFPADSIDADERYGSARKRIMKVDTVVLGAGVIGASIAIRLQQRGRSVALIDRQAAGRETSYGNAGIIQREGVYPYSFPQSLREILRYALKQTTGVNYHLTALPQLAPFLFRYWRNSRPATHAAIARLYFTLIEHCVRETGDLAAAAGVDTLLRPSGWLKVFRSAQDQDEQLAETRRWKDEFGVNFQPLNPVALRALEPDLDPTLIGGLHYTDAESLSDPGRLVDGYRQFLERSGGLFLNGDARTLEAAGGGWRIATAQGPVEASSAVIALGPWSDLVAAKLGYRFWLANKRGYHMHYRPRGAARLNRPVLDVAHGYALAPMAAGIRLTTGIEFAGRHAPKTPVQLARTEPVARTLFPLDMRVDPEPWMGLRPCTADMMPIIGPAPRHRGLWFAFGHAHHGMTLGAVTGRLVAEMMTGEKPFIDPAPFAADRAGVSMV